MRAPFDSVIVHYAEIGLKGRNRTYFERMLMSNMRRKLGKLICSCSRESGLISVSLGENPDFGMLRDILTSIPGIAYFSFAKKCGFSMGSIEECAFELLGSGCLKEFSSFRVRAVRRDKSNKLNSMEINCALGDAIIRKFGKKVMLRSPDLVLKVEVSNSCVYISAEDVAGVGGFPTNTAQRVMCLLSGGFDSPVASYLLMKRGCEAMLVHFQNKNQASSSVEDKIIRIARQLSRYQNRTKLFIVPFEDIQKEIILKVNSKLRMLVYRRFMLRIASRLAFKTGAKFLVVGDSISQVASQTFRNLSATYKGIDTHILSPLIGMDKKEIIDLARQIGTYDISLLPYGDCCSFFIADSPELSASFRIISDAEALFDINTLVDGALSKVKRIDIA